MLLLASNSIYMGLAFGLWLVLLRDLLGIVRLYCSREWCLGTGFVSVIHYGCVQCPFISNAIRGTVYG